MGALSSRLGNSFAYRFNRLATSWRKPFRIELSGRQYHVPLIGALGEANIHLHENWFMRLIRSLQLPAGSDFIDVGANVGQTLLMFRSCYDNPYWGFEPNAMCAFYLNELIQANSFRQVQIIPTGLADKHFLARFFLKHGSDTGATIVDGFRPDYYSSADIQYVPVYALDTLELPLRKIGLVKIDVEGAELEVLTGMQGLLRQHQPPVVCEVLDYHAADSAAMTQERADSLVRLFLDLKYQLFRVRHAGTMLQFEPVERIILRQFDISSYDLNDYLFLPAGATVPAIPA